MIQQKAPRATAESAPTAAATQKACCIKLCYKCLKHQNSPDAPILPVTELSDTLRASDRWPRGHRGLIPVSKTEGLVLNYETDSHKEMARASTNKANSSCPRRSQGAQHAIAAQSNCQLAKQMSAEKKNTYKMNRH